MKFRKLLLPLLILSASIAHAAPTEHVWTPKEAKEFARKFSRENGVQLMGSIAERDWRFGLSDSWESYSSDVNLLFNIMSDAQIQKLVIKKAVINILISDKDEILGRNIMLNRFGLTKDSFRQLLMKLADVDVETASARRGIIHFNYFKFMSGLSCSLGTAIDENTYSLMVKVGKELNWKFSPRIKYFDVRKFGTQNGVDAKSGRLRINAKIGYDEATARPISEQRIRDLLTDPINLIED